MSFIRTLTHSTIILIILVFILFKPFINISIFMTLIIWLIFGYFLCYLFWNRDFDPTLEGISLSYIPIAILAIVFWTGINIIDSTVQHIGFEADRILQENEDNIVQFLLVRDTSLGLREFIISQNILLELIIMTFGVFTPHCILRKHKKLRVNYKRISWNVITIGILYLISITAELLVKWRVFY